MIEIERKYRVADEPELRRKLLGMQAVAEPIERHVDTYYQHPSRDFAATREALRIRRINGRPLVTYKGTPESVSSEVGVADQGVAADQGVKVRQELEWALSPGDRDGSKMALLLQCLGFTEVAEVHKHREPFEVLVGGRRVSVTIDTVERLGLFAEVECLAEGNADREIAIRSVSEVASRLGVTSAESRSYLRMVLELPEPPQS